MDVDELTEFLEAVAVARKSILEHAQHRRGVSGEITCPVCLTGKRRYSIAACNGHVWSHCSTDCCVSWRE